MKEGAVDCGYLSALPNLSHTGETCVCAEDWEWFFHASMSSDILMTI